MKKLFLLLMMTFMQINLFAYEWTDDNGVKWTFSQDTYTINGESQKLWAITGVSNYGDNVEFPSVVYNGDTECTIEAISLGYNYRETPLDASSITIPSTVKLIRSYYTSSIILTAGTITIYSTTPPVISSGVFSSSGVTIIVPNDCLTSYREANVWSEHAVRIISKDVKTDYTVNATARESASGLHIGIGEENLGNVMSLKVSGTINSYDILIIRNKMHNLHYLDMTDATIVASNYPYYESYTTASNTTSPYMFYKMSKLITIKLPKTITKISANTFNQCEGLRELICQGNLETIEGLKNGFSSSNSSVFSGCKNLRYVALNSGLKTIGNCAFKSLYKLKNINLPEGLQSIGAYAFYYCDSLTTINIPGTVTNMGEYAFAECKALTNVTISEGVSAISSYAFQKCNKLVTVALPSTLKKIGAETFNECRKLTNIALPNGLQTIGKAAFKSCSSLTTITIPGSVTSMEEYTFNVCNGLTNVTISEGVTDISSWAFSGCESLATITLPTSLRTINSYAFVDCVLTSINLPDRLTSISASAFAGNLLTELRLPSSITYIGENAFNNCPLKDIYAYTLEPTDIAENTFSTWTTATLHVPTMAYYNYYFDTKWSKFNKVVEDANYHYIYFHIGSDYTFMSTADTSEKPDADLNGGSGLIINNSSPTVTLGDVHIADNGTVSGSIVANDNLSVENLYFDLAVSANKWYFLSLPFKVKMSNVTAPGPYVFRYYDGAARAANGKGGWKNVETDYLEAHTGYIFQTNTAGTLTFQVEPSEISFSDEARQNTMTAHTSANSNNASWNFMGNPFPCYYDIDDTGYEAPITVWTGSAYKAVRPGDDQYHIGPFQAFFVQKPEAQEAINFPFSGCHTYQQWATIVQNKNEQAAARQRAAGANRQLINLTIGNGETTDDYTRIVFNELKSTSYEMDCDAAKFFSPEAVAQLYTVSDNTQYAINERPMGDVQLGYVAAESGYLTITAERMDLPMMLTDHVMSITHNLAEGPYTFTTESGTFNERFTLTASQSGITDIRQLQEQTSAETIIYNLGGQQIMKQNGNGTINLPKGVYVRKSAEKNTKVTIR